MLFGNINKSPGKGKRAEGTKLFILKQNSGSAAEGWFFVWLGFSEGEFALGGGAAVFFLVGFRKRTYMDDRSGWIIFFY